MLSSMFRRWKAVRGGGMEMTDGDWACNKDGGAARWVSGHTGFVQRRRTVDAVLGKVKAKISANCKL